MAGESSTRPRSSCVRSKLEKSSIAVKWLNRLCSRLDPVLQPHMSAAPTNRNSQETERQPNSEFKSWFMKTWLQLAALTSAAINPSVECSSASTDGLRLSAVSLLVVSGPIEAIFKFGNCFSSLGRSKRA